MGALERILSKKQFVGSAVGILLASAALPAVAEAGLNAGATAQLSWDPDSILVDRASTGSEPLMLYLHIRGLASASALAVRLQWIPSEPGSGYVLLADSTGRPPCARMVPSPIPGSFQGDSTYDWSIVLTGEPLPVCVGALFDAEGVSPAAPARFCLLEARTQDPAGEVDEILVLNSATVAGGVGSACSPTLYRLTPTMALGQSAPLVTLVGNGLDSLSRVAAVDPGGNAEYATRVEPRSANFASASFATLPGEGPWDVVAAGAGGAGDTLRHALSSTGILRARFVPLAEFGAEWKLLTPSVVDPWSPNGRFLALHRLGGPLDGLHVFDVTRPAEPPRRVLAQIAPYYTWSPDGGWLLCRVRSDAQWRKGLSSLVAIPVDSGEAVTLVANGDVGLPFLWATNGKIYYWYGDTDQRRELEPPAGWRAENPLPHPPRMSMLWIPPTGHEGGTLLRFAPELQEAAIPGAMDRWRVHFVSPQAAFPDGQRFLVNIQERGRSAYTAIIDRNGQVLHEFGTSHFAPDGLSGSSVSPDGRYVIGCRGIESGDAITGAPLYLAESGGAWIIPVDGGFHGLWPRFSPKDYFLAFEDPVTGHVHVGTLEVGAR